MERNRNLDLLKALCSFMVVYIHASFTGRAGQIFLALSRMAVPLFFMITGYYYTRTKERKNERKQLLKILHLFLGANLLYLIWPLLRNWITNKTVIPYLTSQFNLKSTLSFLFLNVSPLSGHLWYLGAILSVLLIIYFFDKLWDRRKLYPLIPVLLLSNLIFGGYAPVLFGRTIANMWTRNFLCLGLPYFLMGDMIYTRKIKMKSKTALVLALVFAFTTALETFLLETFSGNGSIDHYLSTIFLAIFVFLPTVQHEGSCSKKALRVLAYIGASLSTTIYIVHPYIIFIMEKIAGYLTAFGFHFLAQVYHGLAPFWVFIFTALLAWVLFCITTAIKAKRSNIGSKATNP